jgi:hypothetical protein
MERIQKFVGDIESNTIFHKLKALILNNSDTRAAEWHTNSFM